MNVHLPDRSDRERFAAPPVVDRLGRWGLIVGVVGLVACAAGAATDYAAFSRAWLVGCLFWLGISLGCLGLTMVQHMSGGAWGVVARRLLEAATRTLPLLLVLMAPLLFRLGALYSWAVPGEVTAEPAVAHKLAYLNPTWFGIRFAGYFALWLTLTYLLGRLSAKQDQTGDVDLPRRMRVVSGPGLVIWAFTVSFLAIDWMMSLQPGWFSTIYGVYFFGGFGLAALAFLIPVACLLAPEEPMVRYVTRGHFHDWGKLMLAFLLLWAYFGFSQFLIIWAGNKPEEIGWYLPRFRHGWAWVALVLVFLHFAVPFAILLSRDVKRNPRRLSYVAIGLLVVCWVDLYWQVAPVFHPEGVTLGWLDVAAPIGIGGVWLAAFAWQLKRRPLIPFGDPYLVEAVGHD